MENKIIVDENCRYVLLTGKDIPAELYEKITELDKKEVLPGPASRPLYKSALESNILTTSIIFDQTKQKVIAFQQVFPLTPENLEGFVFKGYQVNNILNYDSTKPIALFYRPVVILEEYRGTLLEDTPTSKLNLKSPMDLLETTAQAVIDVTKQGAHITKFYKEGSTQIEDFNFRKHLLYYYNDHEPIVSKLTEAYNSIYTSSEKQLGDNLNELFAHDKNTDYSKDDNKNKQ